MKTLPSRAAGLTRSLRKNYPLDRHPYCVNDYFFQGEIGSDRLEKVAMPSSGSDGAAISAPFFSLGGQGNFRRLPLTIFIIARDMDGHLRRCAFKPEHGN
jgi:hypothetical protein